MPMNANQKKVANQVLSTLDSCAKTLEDLSKSGKIDPKIASKLVLELDSFADKFETVTYGKDNLAARQAKVLRRDSDEKYMETFENPNKVIEGDDDEPWMHKVGPSFHSKGMDTFDQDSSSSVSERDEFSVRDLSDISDPVKRQPSWPRGSAGKSTHQGSRNPNRRLFRES
jgi:hypothetical protein